MKDAAPCNDFLVFERGSQKAVNNLMEYAGALVLLLATNQNFSVSPDRKLSVL